MKKLCLINIQSLQKSLWNKTDIINCVIQTNVNAHQVVLSNIKMSPNDYCYVFVRNEIVRFAHAIKSNIKGLCVKWGKYVI